MSSAVDELAIATGRDPVDLRRELLAGSPRTVRALELAAERADWASPLPEGRARGSRALAFSATAPRSREVSLDDRGRVRVDRIVFALDCGRNVNPDLIRAQVESGLLWGLSAAAWGEVVLGEGGEIVTQIFDRYPVMRMRSVPVIEVHLIDSTESPTGVGEVSVPCRCASPGERNRSAHGHPNPEAPHLQDHQDLLRKGHRRGRRHHHP